MCVHAVLSIYSVDSFIRLFGSLSSVVYTPMHDSSTATTHIHSDLSFNGSHYRFCVQKDLNVFSFAFWIFFPNFGGAEGGSADNVTATRVQCLDEIMPTEYSVNLDDDCLMLNRRCAECRQHAGGYACAPYWHLHRCFFCFVLLLLNFFFSLFILFSSRCALIFSQFFFSSLLFSPQANACESIFVF